LECLHPTRVRNIYITTAIIWLSASIGIVFFTGACYVFVQIRHPRLAAVLHPYSPHAHAKALHTLSPSAAAGLFSEFDKLEASRMFVYKPWVGFSERTFHSALLNIDEGEPLPIRRTIEPADAGASNKTIWLFGGSTQFGWGVPDDQTIASHLSAILSTSRTHYTVVNYGHTEFYSSQEALLFATLLRHGHKCDIAVFLDGLNDSYGPRNDTPDMTAGTAYGFLQQEDDAAAENSRNVIITPFFPPVRVMNGLLRRLVPLPKASPEAAGRLSETKYDPVAIYRFNMSMIKEMAESEKIQVSFYWQPTPFDYMAGADQRRARSMGQENIPSVNLRVRQTINNRSFHFVADMFKEEAFDDIYVDGDHYGDRGNRMIAQVIADGLKNDGLL